MPLESKSPPVVVVVCALIEDAGGRLLLAQRPAGKHLAGLWEFPGGKVEPGEADAAALARELQEELGCMVTVGVALSPVRHDYGGRLIELRPYLCRVAALSAAPRGCEGQALAWVTAADLVGYSMPPADEPILAEWRSRSRTSAGQMS
jgi:8-oxo-dGTP diphosphatase